MNNQMSDFLKFAYEKGKVKELDEAFVEFNPKDEWHEGKIENVLNEDKHNDSTYSIGDIVFVKEYYYEDGKKGNNHLFVIIDQNNVAVPIENFGMIISSQIEKLKYNQNKLIKKNNKNGLHKDSIVKTDVIYKINNENILFKIGTVDDKNIEEYKKSFYNINKKK